MNTIFYFPKEYNVSSVWPILIFSFIIFPALIISSIKKFSLKNIQLEKDQISLEDSLIYRGIATVVVMIHHYSLRMNHPDKMTYYWYVGYLAVSAFFFLSGYSSMIQLNLKGEKIWNHYLIKRLIRLLIPFWVTNLIYALFYMPSPMQFIKATLSLKQVRGTASEWSIVWFLATIIFFTVLFWMSFRFFHNKKYSLMLFAAGTVLLVVINKFVLDHDHYWYNSSLAFGSGLLYAQYKEVFNRYIKRYKTLIMPVVIICLSIVFMATTKGFQQWWIQMICSELCICLIPILEQCTILSSALFKKIGTASWEIFLIHPLLYSAYYSVFNDKYGFSGIICILTGIVIGLVIYQFDRKFIQYINRCFK